MFSRHDCLSLRVYHLYDKYNIVCACVCVCAGRELCTHTPQFTSEETKALVDWWRVIKTWLWGGRVIHTLICFPFC